MGELYEDRRQEPRFATSGTYELDGAVPDSPNRGRILDLSLNGAKLEHSGAISVKPGERRRVTLSFDGYPSFQGDVLVVHVDSARIGIEFYDMDPKNFAALTGLIDAFNRRR